MEDTMEKRDMTRLGWLMLSGLGLVGCAGPRMVAPHDVAQGSQTLEVSERSSMTGSLVNESFKLGSFAVTDVDRNWNKKSGFSVVGYSNDTTTTGYSYKLQGGAAAWEGSCASSANKKGLGILGGEASWGSSSITCQCKSGGTTASVVLKADSPDASAAKKMGGDLSTGGETKYKVSAVSETDKSNLTDSPAGFRFDGTDGAVGAVEILRPGRVWLNERLPEAERPPVACLSAGLMLYQAPSEH
jgi:hypothetical protein